jgi:hypothetical protein
MVQILWMGLEVTGVSRRWVQLRQEMWGKNWR